MDEWKAVRVGDEPAQGLGEGGPRESGSVRGLEQPRRRLKPGTRVRVSGEDVGNPGRSLCLPPSPPARALAEGKVPGGRKLIVVDKVALGTNDGGWKRGRVENDQSRR